MRNEGIQNSPEGMQKVDKNDFAEASAGKPAVVAAKAREGGVPRGIGSLEQA